MYTYYMYIIEYIYKYMNIHTYIHTYILYIYIFSGERAAAALHAALYGLQLLVLSALSYLCMMP
jgi:hypothetical protein